MSDQGSRFTTGWKVAIVVSLFIALGSGGSSALRRQEESYRKSERRIDELERKVSRLQAVIDGLKAESAR